MGKGLASAIDAGEKAVQTAVDSIGIILLLLRCYLHSLVTVRLRGPGVKK